MIAFDIVRREQSMSKVNIRTKQRAWKKTQQLLEALSTEDIRLAAEQEQKYHKINNPAVLELLKCLSQIGSATLGSDERKSYMLTELKSSIVYHGCPVIYLTINPGDRHSPLALLYAGVQINVDNFIPDEYSFTERVKKLLQNPLAVVEYFHNMIHAIIEGVLKEGMFGEIAHYYGTIEYQGRFTPHMHMAVCLSISFQFKANNYPVMAQRNYFANGDQRESKSRSRFSKSAVEIYYSCCQ